MSLVPSLLQAIVSVDGEALVMHAGDKPYVVSPTGQVDLASSGLTLDAVNGIVSPAAADGLAERARRVRRGPARACADGRVPRRALHGRRGARRRRCVGGDPPPADSRRRSRARRIFRAGAGAVAVGAGAAGLAPSIADRSPRRRRRQRRTAESRSAQLRHAAERASASCALEGRARVAGARRRCRTRRQSAVAAAGHCGRTARRAALPGAIDARAGRRREQSASPATPAESARPPPVSMPAPRADGRHLGRRRPSRRPCERLLLRSPAAGAGFLAPPLRGPAPPPPPVVVAPPPSRGRRRSRLRRQSPLRRPPPAEATRRAAPPAASRPPRHQRSPPAIGPANRRRCGRRRCRFTWRRRWPLREPPATPARRLARARQPPSPAHAEPAVVLQISRNPIRSEMPPPLVGTRRCQASSGCFALLGPGCVDAVSVIRSRPSVRVDGELQLLDGEPVHVARDVESLLLTLMPERSHEALRTGAATEWICDIEDVGRVRCMSFRDHRGPGGVFRLMPTRSVSADQLGLPRRFSRWRSSRKVSCSSGDRDRAGSGR